MRRRFDHTEGVSVIVGTLLLILITVTAAATIAIMVSEFQKEDMKRQSYQRAVDNEDLRITTVDLVGTDIDILSSYEPWEEYWNGTLGWNITLTNNTVYQNNISSWEPWTSMEFDIQNMNIDDTKIAGVRINDRYALVWDEKSTDTNGDIVYTSHEYNDTARVVVPGADGTTLRIMFPTGFDRTAPHYPYLVEPDETITLTLITSYYNTFTQTFTAPVPVAHYTIEREDFLTADQAVLVLNGESSTDDDGTVVKWDWTLVDNSTGTPVTHTYEGKEVSVPLSNKGPYTISLTVTDNDGLKTAMAESIQIAESKMFAAPPVDILVEEDAEDMNGDTLIIRVYDLNGEYMSNIPITVVPFGGNITMNGYSGQTSSSTLDPNVTFKRLSGSGTVHISSGNLAPEYWTWT